MFAIGTTVLAPEIIERHDPEYLASKLVTIEHKCKVKIEKSKTTFSVTGSWENLNHAHRLFIQIFNGQDRSDDLKLKENSDASIEHEEKLIQVKGIERVLPNMLVLPTGFYYHIMFSIPTDPIF